MGFYTDVTSEYKPVALMNLIFKIGVIIEIQSDSIRSFVMIKDVQNSRISSYV